MWHEIAPIEKTRNIVAVKSFISKPWKHNRDAELQLYSFSDSASGVGKWTNTRLFRHTTEKELPVPTEQKAVWAPEQTWGHWRRQKSHISARDWTYGPTARNLVTISSTLPKLQVKLQFRIIIFYFFKKYNVRQEIYELKFKQNIKNKQIF